MAIHHPLPIPVLLSLLLALSAGPGCPSSDDDDDASSDDDSGDDDTGDDDSGDDDTGDDDSGDDDVGDPPLFTELSGWVRISERMHEDQVVATMIQAEFWATPVPSTQVVVAAEGDCQVLDGARTEPWLCDPPCDVGFICIDEVCEPYPELAPTGTLTIEGLVEPVAIEPDETGRYAAIYDLPADSFDPGEPIRVTSSGGATAALDLTAEGVADFQMSEWSHVLVPGEDYELLWEPATGDDAGGTVRVQLDTGWHGSASLTTILCETDDDGELVIPGSLTELFVIPSCGECEFSTIGRLTRDWIDTGDGFIELRVASDRSWVPWWGEW